MLAVPTRVPRKLVRRKSWSSPEKKSQNANKDLLDVQYSGTRSRSHSIDVTGLKPPVTNIPPKANVADTAAMPPPVTASRSPFGSKVFITEKQSEDVLFT